VRYVDEYRDGDAARALVGLIERTVTRPWVIMEVCGGQTHTIVKYGIDEILSSPIELVHGPGCPVCVTSLETIDRAHAIASRADVTFCSLGDMLPNLPSQDARHMRQADAEPLGEPLHRHTATDVRAAGVPFS